MSKKKLTFFEMCKRVSYYDFLDTWVTKKDGTKIKGVLYKIDRMLTSDEKKKLAEFGNVRFYVSQCQYAPEIKTSCIFLGNKCF